MVQRTPQGMQLLVTGGGCAARESGSLGAGDVAAARRMISWWLVLAPRETATAVHGDGDGGVVLLPHTPTQWCSVASLASCVQHAGHPRAAGECWWRGLWWRAVVLVLGGVLAPWRPWRVVPAPRHGTRHSWPCLATATQQPLATVQQSRGAVVSPCRGEGRWCLAGLAVQATDVVVAVAPQRACPACLAARHAATTTHHQSRYY